jgi:hypothetical protein
MGALFIKSINGTRIVNDKDKWMALTFYRPDLLYLLPTSFEWRFNIPPEARTINSFAQVIILLKEPTPTKEDLSSSRDTSTNPEILIPSPQNKRKIIQCRRVIIIGFAGEN